MPNTIMIIDDDISIVKMIEQIIKKNSLGKLAESLTSGRDAVDEILFYNPDILLIDYLLPYKDGSEIVKEVIDRGFEGKIIMISQVEDEPMVSNAYNKGVLFFIKKPINSIELTNVIKNVSQSLELERSMSLIKSVLGNVEGIPDPMVKVDHRQRIEGLFSEIGIIGILGSSDLVSLVEKVIIYKERSPNLSYKLQELYDEIANDNKQGSGSKVNTKTIEQRIRRIIQKALSNLAEIGLDDYSNPIFVDYSSLLFDFKQIKQEMDYIKGQSMYRGKIKDRKSVV